MHKVIESHAEEMLPFKTWHSRGKTKADDRAQHLHEAPIPSPSKIIIGGKSIDAFNYIVTNFMVHPCLKMNKRATQL